MKGRTPVLLGSDLGTTVLKLCALDGRTGAEFGGASRRLAVIELPRGGREQEPRSIDRAFASAAREVRERVDRKSVV